MAIVETIAKWLKNSAGKIVVPKTYASCVYDANGETVESKMADLQSQINAGGGGGGGGDTTIRYVESTDYIQVKENGEWKNFERAFANILKTDFKAIKLTVTAINRNNPYVQFSEIRFRKPSGEFFTFSDTVATASGSNTSGDLKNGVDGNEATKICISFTTDPVWFYQVVNGKLINMTEYPIFEIVNASDQASYGRIPVSFKLEASVNMTDWATLVEETNITPLSEANLEVAYRKNLTEALKNLS